jgi:hypothetical protein
MDEIIKPIWSKKEDDMKNLMVVGRYSACVVIRLMSMRFLNRFGILFK